MIKLKKVLNVLSRYFNEIGKELKLFTKDNVKEILIFLSLIVCFILFFVIPKVMLMIVCTSFVTGLGVVLLSMLYWDFIESTNRGLKYPYLSTTVYALTSLILIALIILADILIFKGFLLE